MLRFSTAIELTMLSGRVRALARLLLLLFIISTMLPCFGQDSLRRQDSTGDATTAATTATATTQSQGSANSDACADETMFYAYLQEDPGNATGPLYEFLRDKPIVQQLFGLQTRQERKFRPLMQWRHWADKQQKFFPSFLLITAIGFLTWAIFPTFMQAAAEKSRKSFWKCFGRGLLVAFITMTILRAIFISELGWPLGIVITGVSQACALLGLSVSLYNLGHAVISLLGINKTTAVSSRPGLSRALDILSGSLLAALLLQIPSFAGLPPCGTRLLALFAILGVGALYLEMRQRRSASSNA